MRKLGVNELREEYLKFFESKAHLRIPSASLIPKNDPSILLINAGMTPMKAYFTGDETPPAVRLTNSQKSIRTADIENVGFTDRHGTFFEMLGNFSFGDYFKEEMIPWIWEFCTEILEMDPARLYPTVFMEDDEAYDIWTKTVGIPEDHVLRFGKEENWWEHGVGPAGPCTEVLYDRGVDFCGLEECKPDHDCDRYMEFWNSVFTQYYRHEDGTYTELNQKNIDTGVGLERLAVLSQEVGSMFEIDTVKAVLDTACEIADVTYKVNRAEDVSIRIITDHVRAATMMIGDGITPSNGGRGYVLRRLIRRAVRHGSLLGVEENFLARLVEVVIEQSGDAFPEIVRNHDFIVYTVDGEESTFRKTLSAGSKILEGYIADAKADNLTILPGKQVFLLHDTYGFPLDLTKEVAEESGLTIDEAGYHELMDEQRKRAQANTAKNVQSAWGGDMMPAEIHELEPTVFTGYETLEDTGKVLYILKEAEESGAPMYLVDEAVAGEHITFVTDKTPFFGTGGGQIGDYGMGYTDNAQIKIDMTTKNRAKVDFHQAVVQDGTFKVGDIVELKVDEKNRWDTARNHTGTHLLHTALRNVIGTHVTQAGSEFNGEYFRFDFNHQGALTAEQIEAVEDEVNKQILADLDVSTYWQNVEEAKEDGVLALFDETYDAEMRVVSIGGDYSKELCGGTHLFHTSQVGSFHIVAEYSVAAGVRRIEAVTGFNALDRVKADRKQLNDLAKTVNSNVSDVNARVESLLDRNKDLEAQIKQLEVEKLEAENAGLTAGAENINGINLLITEVEAESVPQMRDLGDKLMAELEPAVIVLGRRDDDKVNFIVMSSDEAISLGVKAGDIVKVAAQVAQGGGGGKANMAQAGGKDVTKLEEALAAAEVAVKEILV